MQTASFFKEKRRLFVCACGVLAAVLAMPSMATADAEKKALAKQSQNPVAKLISVPFENNYNGEYGPNNSDQNVLNIKPVIPLAIGKDWNLINRVIMPFVSQPGIPGGPNRQNGLGDTTYQAFISPSNPGKVIWGAGPSVQLPTHTDEVLGNENWAAGPALVLLSMPGHWVFGGVISQVWDFASSSNDGSDDDISLMVLQPFVNYNYAGGWYLSSAPVITANFEADKSSDEWTVPVGGGVGRVFRLGKQAINAKMAYYYNVEKPNFGAQWDLQFTVTFLFPK
jgi:hypothetical protein